MKKSALLLLVALSISILSYSSLPTSSASSPSQKLKTSSDVVEVQIYHDAFPVDGGAPGAAEFLPLCLDSNATPHLQAIYAYDASEGVKLQDIKDIRTMMEESDRIVFLSADQQKGGRRLRMGTEPSTTGCQVSVIPVPIPHSYFSTGDETVIRDSLKSAGFADQESSINTGVIPITFINHDIVGTLSCGVGYNYIDDAINGYNSRPSVNLAEIWHGCWNAYTAIHEIMHTLGAVQDSAPHATTNGHCTDGVDIMCYDDSGDLAGQQFICPSTPYRPGGLLDCNADDYFAISPAPGSYLATHYNVANNSPYVITVPYSGVAAPQITVKIDPKASALPFVGVPFTAVVNAPGGLLYMGGSQLQNNRDCGVQVKGANNSSIKGMTTPLVISGIAYCKNPDTTIVNLNNILIIDKKPFSGSAISIVDSLGRDIGANINFTLIKSSSKLQVKVTENVKFLPGSNISSPYTVTLNIKGRLPGSKLFNTPLIGVDYIALDQTTMKLVSFPGLIGSFATTDSTGTIVVNLPGNLAGHLIDLEQDVSSTPTNWQIPITQFTLPKKSKATIKHSK